MLTLPLSVIAHEMRPAYARLVALDEGRVEIEFRQPVIGGRFLNLRLQVDCPDLTSPVTSGSPSAITERWTADCRNGLDEVSIAGLSSTVIDVLLTWEPADGPARTIVITPQSPVASLEAKPAPLLPVYLTLGITHLLEGLDHVFFVVGLMLIVSGPWRIVKTITSFTVAHSLTLALSILDVVRLSQAPVEAAIALSLVFIAWENVAPDRAATLTARRPWQIAFLFGLLHGLGFAGVLREIGLPEAQFASALLLFNLGIEVGQLIIVASVLIVAALWRRLNPPVETALARLAPIYVIGSISCFWLIERVAALTT